MKLHALLLLTISLSAANASAANEFGNGGDVIICADGKVEFFDWYETHDKHGWPIQVPHGATLAEKVDHLLERMLPLNPWRVSKYKKQAATFWSEAKFIPEGRRLVDIPDTDNAYIPDNCKIAQLVVQGKPVFPGDMQYTFDRDYWNRLSLDQQAAVVVHEIILRDATENSGQKDSRRTRYANALILSDQLKNFSDADMVKALGLLGLNSADAFGFYLEEFSYQSLNDTYSGRVSPEMVGKEVSFGPISGTMVPASYLTHQGNAFFWSPSKDRFSVLIRDFNLLTKVLPGMPNELIDPIRIYSANWASKNSDSDGAAYVNWSGVQSLLRPEVTFSFVPDHFDCAKHDADLWYGVENGKFDLTYIGCIEGELWSMQGFRIKAMSLRNGKPVAFLPGPNDNIGNIQSNPWMMPNEQYEEFSMYYKWPFHLSGYIKTATCYRQPSCKSIEFVDGSTRDVKSGEVCEFEDKPTERAISCE